MAGMKFAVFSTESESDVGQEQAVVAKAGKLKSFPSVFVSEQAPVYDKEKGHDNEPVIVSDQLVAGERRFDSRS